MATYRIQAVSTSSELVAIILFKVTRAIEKRFTHLGEPLSHPQLNCCSNSPFCTTQFRGPHWKRI